MASAPATAAPPNWNPSEVQWKVFQEWKLNTIQHLVSCKKGIQPFKLPGMLKEVTDERIPLDKMGFEYAYRNINVFLYEMRDALEVRKVDEKLYVFVRESSVPEKLQHIRKMVLGQKGKADKPLRHHGIPVPATHLLRYGTGRPEEPSQSRRGGHPSNRRFISGRTPTSSSNFKGKFPSQPRPFVRPSGTGMRYPATTTTTPPVTRTDPRNSSQQNSTLGTRPHFTNALDFINLGNPNAQRVTAPTNRSNNIAAPRTATNPSSSAVAASRTNGNTIVRTNSSAVTVPRTPVPMAPRTVTNTPSTATIPPTIPRTIPKAADIYDWGTPPPTPSTSQYSNPVRKAPSSLAQRLFPDVYGEENSDDSDKYEFYSGPCTWPPQKENSPPAPTPSTVNQVKPVPAKPATVAPAAPPTPRLFSKPVLSLPKPLTPMFSKPVLALPKPLIPEKVWTPPRPTPEPSPQDDCVDIRSAPAIKVGIGSDKRTSFIDAVFNFRSAEIPEDFDEEDFSDSSTDLGNSSTLAQAITSAMLPEKITKLMEEPKTVSDLKDAEVKDKPTKGSGIRYGYSLDTDVGLHSSYKPIPSPVPMKDFVYPPRILNFQRVVMFPPYLTGPPTGFKTFLKESGQLDKFMNSL